MFGILFDNDIDNRYSGSVIAVVFSLFVTFNNDKRIVENLQRHDIAMVHIFTRTGIITGSGSILPNDCGSKQI